VRDREVPTATVVVAVFARPAPNAVEVSKAVEDLPPDNSAHPAAAVQIKTIYDRSLSIKHSIIDVQETLVIAFVLLVLVIFFFLGRRPTH
jgi:HAE1 family hydrophobic/amphiphilic exporter-1